MAGLNEKLRADPQTFESLQPGDSSNRPSTSEQSFEVEPKFFLYIQNDRVEGYLAPFPTVIDFSLPNTRILHAEFVCLRKVMWPSSAPTKDQSTPSRGFLRSFFSNMMAQRGGRTPPAPQEQEKLETPVLQSYWRPHHPSGVQYTAGTREAMEGAADEWDRGEPCAQAGYSTGSSSFRLFELIWKEVRPSAQIKQLKFETNCAGYRMISRKLDSWAAAAHSWALEADPTLLLLSIMRNASAQNSSSPRQSLELSPRASGRANGSHPQGEEGQRDPETPKSPEPSRSILSMLSPRGKGLRSPTLRAGEPLGMLPAGRARMDAAKAAVDIVGLDLRLDPLPDNVISWGSVVVEGKILPQREGESCVLRTGHFQALAASLPARFRSCTWALHYSSSRDGISLNTLYRKVAKQGPLLLVVRDSNHFVFGCYCSEEWKVHKRYYGNGECFVFQVQPELRAFRWTRANSYFMFSTPSTLAMGGGTHYSLLLNSDLLTGYSGECETFGSGCLAGSEEFRVAKVEVWGFK